MVLVCLSRLIFYNSQCDIQHLCLPSPLCFSCFPESWFLSISLLLKSNLLFTRFRTKASSPLMPFVILYIKIKSILTEAIKQSSLQLGLSWPYVSLSDILVIHVHVGFFFPPEFMSSLGKSFSLCIAFQLPAQARTHTRKMFNKELLNSCQFAEETHLSGPLSLLVLINGGDLWRFSFSHLFGFRAH